MIVYGHGTFGYILTLFSLLFALFTCILSFIIVSIILHHLYRRHRQFKREEKIILILSSYIYTILFILTTILISINIQTLIGDMYGNIIDSSRCEFQGYCLSISASAMYYTFVVQALFCLLRIVYSNYRPLQCHWIFSISGPVVFIVASVVLSPILFWHGIIYFPREHFCQIPFTNIRAVLWGAFFTYIAPLICIFAIYTRIIVFLRQQSNNLAFIIKQRQERNLLVFRCIFISVGVLLSSGLPGIVLVFMALVNGMEYPLGQRIAYFAYELSFAIVSVEMILMTPQLKRFMLNRWQRTRVANFHSPIPMKAVVTIQ